MFPFFKSPRTLLDSHDFLNMMQALQPHQTVPSGPWVACHQAPLTCCTHSVSSGLKLALLLFCSSYSHLKVPGLERFGKPDCQWRLMQRTSWVLDLLHAFCSQFLFLIYQRGYILFGLCLLTNIPVEFLLVILCIPRQLQFHVCLGFPDPITAHSDSIPVFTGNMSLLPLLVLFLLIHQFDLQVLV